MKRLKFGSLFISLSLIKTFRDKFIIVLFSLCLINATSFAGAWEELAGSATGGGVSNNTGGSNWPSLALDSSGNPHIAWVNTLGVGLPTDIYYAYWDGDSWETYGGANTGGGVSNNGGDSYWPSLALDSLGYPHIAWFDTSGGDTDIYYAYWDGDSWETYGGANTGGGVSNNAGDSGDPSLALDSLGNPHIAWHDNSGGGAAEIYYAYWDGDSWETYGGANTGGGVSNNTGGSSLPSLALDSSSNPHIAWTDESGPGSDNEIYYAYWDGDSWETYGGANTGGGVSNNAGDSRDPSLALDSSSNPHIAWTDASGPGGDPEIYYAYWDGDSWETYGGANTGVGVSNNSNNSSLPSLALDSSGNSHIAWSNILGAGSPADIYYAYWDGTNWVTHGGANTGGGVSNDTDWSQWPSLALDSSGYPHIAWYTSGGAKIYYRYFVPEICNNGIDDDGDGLIDCDDPECPPCTTTTTTTTTTTSTTTSTTTTTFVCWCPADSFTGCVSGQVTNSEGEPLAEKKVWFKGRLFLGGPRFNMRTRTDDDGCYKFNLPEGIGKIWVIGCRGGGKKDVSVPFGGKVNDVNFECKKRRR